MKIRQGFVSNSSSSSFLICLDKLPNSECEVKKLLGIDKKKEISIYNCAVSTSAIAETVFNDLISAKDLTKNEAREQFDIQYGAFPGFDEWKKGQQISDDDFNMHDKFDKKVYDKYLEENRKFVDKHFNLWWKNNAKDRKHVRLLEYADDNRLGTCLEQSGILERIGYRICKH
jgi:hypothetical protein